MGIGMHATTYKSIDVSRLSIFYGEGGSPDAPTLLLLHGFPSSSRMYEPLFTRLADVFHLVAPDYPGSATARRRTRRRSTTPSATLLE
jgi:pimeloyl-ACP methyl ester carboxylesterase